MSKTVGYRVRRPKRRVGAVVRFHEAPTNALIQYADGRKQDTNRAFRRKVRLGIPGDKMINALIYSRHPARGWIRQRGEWSIFSMLAVKMRIVAFWP